MEVIFHAQRSDGVVALQLWQGTNILGVWYLSQLDAERLSNELTDAVAIPLILDFNPDFDPETELAPYDNPGA